MNRIPISSSSHCYGLDSILCVGQNGHVLKEEMNCLSKMVSSFMKRWTLPWLGALLLLLEVGCGSVSPPTKEALEARCKAYWDLRVKGDWGSIYSCLTPDERKFVTRDKFVRERSQELKYLSYQIESVEVRGNEGTTTAQCKWRVTLPGDDLPYRGGETTLTEYWLFAGDNWYLKMFNPLSK
jgi:hypothetical protein